MKSKRAPEIRFKGFDGEWNRKKIGDLFIERNQRSDIGELLSVTIDSGVIKASSLERRDSSSNNKANYKKVEYGDIAYNSMRMWQGASGFSAYSGIVSPAYTVIIPDVTTSSRFFSYHFKRHQMIQLFKSRSQGLTSDTWNLKFPLLKEITVATPTFKEQNQIGNFFKQLDETISLHQQELDKLKQTKQGFLQKMFPKEGECVPEVRFAGFSGLWVEKKMEDVASISSGGTPSRDNPDYWYGDIPWATTTEVNYKMIMDTDEKITREGLNNSSAKLMPIGTVLLAMYGQGKTRGQVGILGIEAATNQANANIEINNDICNLVIYYQLVKNYMLIRKSANEGGQANLSLGIVKKIKVILPKTFEEQLQIGNFFKQLDDLIALKERELEAVKQTKRAFLQKIFI